MYRDMLICAEYLHCTLDTFQALPRDEKTRWRLFFYERNRREAKAIDDAKRKAGDL